MNVKSVSIVAVLSLGLAACSESQPTKTQMPTQSTSQTASAPTPNQPTYTVVTELNTLPFIIRGNQLAGGITGFEYDLLTEIAKNQGFQLKFDVHPWQGIFTTLDDGKADIVAGAVTYTDERAQKMDFSQPHYEYHYVAIVNQKNASAKNFAELKGKMIALQRKSVSESLIPMFISDKNNESNILKTDTIWLATKDVLSGKADAAIGSDAPLSYYAKEYADHKLTLVRDDSLPAQHYVFAVKKGNSELVKKLNDGLTAIKNDGTYDKLYQKYWK